MTSSIGIPANFGIELLKLKSNNITLDSADGAVQASAVILSLNSPVIREQVLGADKTIIDFQGYSKESVKLFLKACYQGRLDLERKNMSHLHKMSHNFEVYWMTEAVLDDFKNRVKRCTVTYCFDTALFLFKEAVSTLFVLRKRTFVDVFIQAFAGVPEQRERFLGLYLKNMHKYSAEELKIAVELSGGRVDIVVNALTNHILEFKRLDTNARGVLNSINFSYLETEHPSAYKAIFDVLVKNMQNLEKEDMGMILRLRHGIQLEADDGVVLPVAWDRNITLTNLFHTRLAEEDEEEEYEDPLCDSLKRTTLSMALDRESPSPASSKVCSHSDDGSAEYFSSKEDDMDCEELEDSTLEEDDDSPESEASADSSNSDTRDTAQFKSRMLKLMAAESVCNLYMFIEDLWDWISKQGQVRLDIDFRETMKTVNNIKTHRGWFPICSEFLDKLENLCQNQNVTQFKDAIKNSPSLISDDSNFRIISGENVKHLLQGKNKAKVGFQFTHKDGKDCTQKGICGFLFKLSLEPSTDDFKMEMGYSKSDYKDKVKVKDAQDCVHLDFHDHLMFAQRMHVMLTGYKGTTFSLPLSWEGKPKFDEHKNMVSWGRHNFLPDKTPKVDANLGEEVKDSPKSMPGSSEQGTSAGTASDVFSDKVYNWEERDEVRFDVYYCTA